MPHEGSEVRKVLQIVTALKVEEQAISSLYNETVHAVQVNQDMAAFESFKNQFTNQAANFQQALASHSESMKDAIKEEEHR